MKIDEKTQVSLFAAITSIPILVSSLLWIFTISAKVDQANAKYDWHEERINKQEKVLSEIREITIRIDERTKKMERK